MLTSALISKFIDVLAQADVESNPDFITVVNNAIDETYESLSIEGVRPMCASKIAFTPTASLEGATLEAPKKKRGWPKGKPRKPKAKSMEALPVSDTGEPTLVISD